MSTKNQCSGCTSTKPKTDYGLVAVIVLMVLGIVLGFVSVLLMQPIGMLVAVVLLLFSVVVEEATDCDMVLEVMRWWHSRRHKN